MERISTDAELAYRKKYYLAHREEILEKKKKRYLQDPQKYRDQCKEYGMTHDRSEYFRKRYLKRKEGVVIG